MLAPGYGASTLGSYRRGEGSPVRAGDRIRTTIEWEPSHFKNRRGAFLEERGDRRLVHLDGDAAPVLLFTYEVAHEEPEQG